MEAGAPRLYVGALPFVSSLADAALRRVGLALQPRTGQLPDDPAEHAAYGVLGAAAARGIAEDQLKNGLHDGRKRPLLVGIKMAHHDLLRLLPLAKKKAASRLIASDVAEEEPDIGEARAVAARSTEHDREVSGLSD